MKEREREMAGDRVSTNNESRDGAGGEDEVEGVEPHSRVGGIPECAVAAAAEAKPSVVDGLCRYAQGATSGGLSFLEVCQVGRERECGSKWGTAVEDFLTVSFLHFFLRTDGEREEGREREVLRFVPMAMRGLPLSFLFLEIFILSNLGKRLRDRVLRECFMQICPFWKYSKMISSPVFINREFVTY